MTVSLIFIFAVCFFFGPAISQNIVVDIDCGGPTDALDSTDTTSSRVASNPSAVIMGSTMDDARYRRYRYLLFAFPGPLTYTLSQVPAGAYLVELHFAEIYEPNCALGRRVFDVSIQGTTVLSNFDVYASGNSVCRQLVIETFSAQVGAGGLVIALSRVTENPMIAGIVVKRTGGGGDCVPVGDGGNSGEDHRAHAVPGSYPPVINANSPISYVDTDGDGFETVFINGLGSHTHFAAATIVSYRWTIVETGEVVSEEATFSYAFPLGTTTLLLDIKDSTCDETSGETTVTVTGALKSGMYCYYYNENKLPAPGGLQADTVKPTFAYEYLGDFTGELQSAPPEFEGGIFSARCTFLFEADESEATTFELNSFGTGDAQLYNGKELVVPAANNQPSVTSISAGLSVIEIVFLRTDAVVNPSLVLRVNSTIVSSQSMSFDRATVLPVLSSITPSEVSVTGGVTATVRGYGFYTAPFVSFGNSRVQANENGLIPTSFQVVIPPGPEGAAAVTASFSTTATDATFQSNVLDFQYGNGVEEVRFTRIKATQAGGGALNLNNPTSVAVFNGAYYFGRLGGDVLRLEVNDQFEVTSQCTSDVLSDVRFTKNGLPSEASILGIAFDPRDTVGRPYVSVSTLHWFYRNKIDSSPEAGGNAAWRNGRIERLRPKSTGSTCLEFDSRVVDGLPVSDHDHSANGMVFDNDGNLFLAVGGVTNGGIVAQRFGFVYETPLSAALLKFPLGAPNFNGVMTYSPDTYEEHPQSQLISGDVEVFATGLRMAFDIAFTSQERFFGTDNGPNAPRAPNQDVFGRTATSCDQVLPVDGLPGVSRPDEIMEITAGSYYGHPNFNRGECGYVDPFSNRLIDGQNPPDNYKPAMFTVQSSVNGIIEYTAEHFNSALKGEMIVSTFSNQGNKDVYRVRVQPPRLLTLDADWAALSVAQGVFGELIFPKYTGDLNILQPDYPFPTSLSARVVSPFRGGAGGGLEMRIAGHNFGTSPTATINGANCPISSTTETAHGSLIICTLPARGAGGNLVDVAVTSSGVTSIITDGFMYMNN